MTMRLSTGLRNFLAKGGSISQALQNGRIEIYTGAQPTSPDAAVTGTLLCTITNNSGTLTPETLATGTITLSGSAGSINTITVGGINIIEAAVPFNGTLNQTAQDLAAMINRTQSNPEYTATAVGAVVTISAAPGSGTSPNTLTVAGTLTTMTATYTAMASGVAAANGLQFDLAANGAMNKLLTQVWSGLNVATGTAGWFRQYGGPTDVGGLDANAQFNRIDGAIASSGAELNFNSTAFTSGATTTLAGWVVNVPAQ
jgi:hypothetical protein